MLELSIAVRARYASFLCKMLSMKVCELHPSMLRSVPLFDDDCVTQG
jgi:hypothetical protein